MNRQDVTDLSDHAAPCATVRSPAATSGPSYRRSNRTPAYSRMAIYPRGRGGRIQPQAARLSDYSASGIGLVSNEPVEPGTRFAVRLVRPDGSKLALAFEVVYCRPAGKGSFQVGAKLPEQAAAQRRANFQTSISGKTVSGWERVLDIRADDDRLWLNMHPPDRESGWGMFIDRDELEAALQPPIERAA